MLKMCVLCEYVGYDQNDQLEETCPQCQSLVYGNPISSTYMDRKMDDFLIGNLNPEEITQHIEKLLSMYPDPYERQPHLVKFFIGLARKVDEKTQEAICDAYREVDEREWIELLLEK